MSFRCTVLFLGLLPWLWGCGGGSPSTGPDILSLDVSEKDTKSVADALFDPGLGNDLAFDTVPEPGFVDEKTQELPPPEDLCAGSFVDLTAGLDPRTILRHPGTPGNAPHLSEIVVFSDHAYIANSFDALTAVHLAPEEMSITLAKPLGPTLPRCTTLALHEESLSLYCAAPDQLWPIDEPKLSRIAVFDLSNPGEPLIRDLGAVKSENFFFRDLHVQGDTLYAAAFEQGLVKSMISSDGALSVPESTEINGHVVQVSGSGTKLAILDSDRGLVLLDGAETSLSELAVQPLNGPLMDLTMDEERIAVALGSMGVSLFTYSTEGVDLLAEIQPKCVVTGVALKGEALALTCTSGVYLYDLASESPSLIGFVPARFNMLDLFFTDGGLLVADWEEIAFFSVDTSGSVLMPDIPRGRYIAPGAGTQFPIRNPRTLPMYVDIYLDKPLHRDLKVWKASYVLAGGETLLIQFSAAELAEYMDPLWREAIVRVHSKSSVCHKGAFDVGEDQRSGVVKIVERWEMDPAEEGHPAVDEIFPQISVDGMTAGESVLPEVSVPSYLVFFGWDCAAMWPQLLDLSWLHAQGLVPDSVQPLALSRGSVAESSLLGERWRVSNILAGIYDENHGSVLAADGPIFHGSALYTAAFFIGDIPGGAEHPTDYLVGNDGRVFAVEKLYRGQWPLRGSVLVD